MQMFYFLIVLVKKYENAYLLDAGILKQDILGGVGLKERALYD